MKTRNVARALLRDAFAAAAHDQMEGFLQDPYTVRHRYYDPVVGRFVSEDPAGFDAGDSNLYRYVGNDPVNKTDPTGLCGQNTSTNLFSPSVLGGSYFSPATSSASSPGNTTSQIFNLSNWASGISDWASGVASTTSNWMSTAGSAQNTLGDWSSSAVSSLASSMGSALGNWGSGIGQGLTSTFSALGRTTQINPTDSGSEAGNQAIVARPLLMSDSSGGFQQPPPTSNLYWMPMTMWSGGRPFSYDNNTGSFSLMPIRDETKHAAYMSGDANHVGQGTLWGDRYDALSTWGETRAGGVNCFLWAFNVPNLASIDPLWGQAAKFYKIPSNSPYSQMKERDWLLSNPTRADQAISAMLAARQNKIPGSQGLPDGFATDASSQLSDGYHRVAVYRHSYVILGPGNLDSVQSIPILRSLAVPAPAGVVTFPGQPIHYDFHAITQAVDGTWTGKGGFSGSVEATNPTNEMNGTLKKQWNPVFIGYYAIKAPPRASYKQLFPG